MSIFDLFKQIESQKPAVTGPPEWIIAGLGNIGDKYKGTRHNAGFMMIDAFAEKCGAKFGKHQFKSDTAMTECGGIRCLLLKPDTFMNLSGQAVTEAMQFYQIPPEHVIVIYDDINLGVGELRIRKKGSDGGHNGMKNIIYLSGADTFPRIRVGIGQKPHPDYDLADWVLSAFSQDDLKKLAETAETVGEALPLMLKGNTDLAMNRFNTGKQKKPKPEKAKPADAPAEQEAPSCS
ncbi:MAG: aminoacyl-tRNA hydrolase [Oscillospiraceae bacterium]|nr:aminoacyl-tRNA hydrolase [Oscillospiraceae bacterium]